RPRRYLAEVTLQLLQRLPQRRLALRLLDRIEALNRRQPRLALGGQALQRLLAGRAHFQMSVQLGLLRLRQCAFQQAAPAPWVGEGSLRNHRQPPWEWMSFTLQVPNLLLQPGQDSTLGQVDGGDAQALRLSGLVAGLALDGGQPEGPPGRFLEVAAHLLHRPGKQPSLVLPLPQDFDIVLGGGLFLEELLSGATTCALELPLTAGEEVVQPIADHTE